MDSIWTEVSGVFKESAEIYKNQFVPFTIAGLIASIGMLLLLPGPPLLFGLTIMTLKAKRGETVKINDVFKGFDYFVVSWALLLLISLVVGVGFVLMIIPGLVLLAVLQYAETILINENRKVIDSIQRSIDIAKKYFWFSLIVAIIDTTLILLSGLSFALEIFTIPLSSIFVTNAYLNLKEKEDLAKSN